MNFKIAKSKLKHVLIATGTTFVALSAIIALTGSTVASPIIENTAQAYLVDEPNCPNRTGATAGTTGNWNGFPLRDTSNVVGEDYPNPQFDSVKGCFDIPMLSFYPTNNLSGSRTKTLGASDTVSVQIYYNNSAVVGGEAITNPKALLDISQDGSKYTVKGNLTGSATATSGQKGGDLDIIVPAGYKLEYVSRTAKIYPQATTRKALASTAGNNPYDQLRSLENTGAGVPSNTQVIRSFAGVENYPTGYTGASLAYKDTNNDGVKDADTVDQLPAGYRDYGFILLDFKPVIAPGANLEIAKDNLPKGEVKKDQVIDYTLNYKNIGGTTATNVVITDPLDSKLKFVSCSNSCTNNNNTLSWAIGNVAAGASASVTFKATVNANEGTVINQAKIKSTEIPEKPSNPVENPIKKLIPPVAVDDSRNTKMNTAVSITILENDSDVDGFLQVNPCTIVIKEQPKNGTVAIDTAKCLAVYTPNNGYTGIDTFKYTIKDNDNLESNIATVTITIPKDKVPPVADDKRNVVITQGADTAILLPTPASQILTGTDADGTITKYIIKTLVPTTDGVVTLNGVPVVIDQVILPADVAKLSFKPTASFVGETKFTYTVEDNDGLRDETPATYTIPVEVKKTSVLEIVKENNPTGTVKKGDEITYSLKFRNTGNATATNVVVSDVIGDKAEYVANSCTLNCKVNGKTVSWELPTLAPSQNYIVGTFKVKVTADEGVVRNVATIKSTETPEKPSNPVENPIKKLVPPVADDKRNVVITQGADTAILLPTPASQILTGTDADGTITKYIIKTLVPTTDGVVTLNGVPVVIDQVILPADVAKLSFKPTATFVGETKFTYTVEDNDGLRDETPATYTIPVEAKKLPNLEIVKTNSPTGNVKKGDEITYTLKFKNTGNGNATNVVVSDTISEKAEYVANSCTLNCVVNGKTVSWNVATLVPNQEITGTFKVKVTGDEGVVKNVALIKSNEVPEKPSNPVENPIKNPILEVIKENNPTGTVKKGDEITYSLKFRNIGETTATNVVISDVIGDKAEYVVNSCTLNCKVNGKTVSWELPTLAPSQNYIVGTFKVKVTADEGVVRNVATIKSTETPEKPSNPVENPIKKLIPPVAVNDEKNTKVNTPVEILILTNDSDPDGTLQVKPCTIVIKEQPKNGTVKVDLEKCTAVYTPNNGYTGQDTFKYTIKDNDNLESNIATVTINIPKDKVPPVADEKRNVVITQGADTALLLPNPKAEILTGTDADGTIVKYIIKTLVPSTDGVVTLNGTPVKVDQVILPADVAKLSFKPTATFVGETKFTYTVEDNDGLRDETPAIYTIPVEVKKLPNLEVVKSNSPTGTVKKGDEITYTLKFRNTGNVAATNVVVSDIISDKAEYVANSCTLNCKVNGKTISWELPSLSPSQEYIVGTFKVQVTAEEGVVKNVAAIKSTETPEKPSNPVENPIKKLVPPVAKDDSSTTKINTPIDISILVNDNDPDGTLLTKPCSIVIKEQPKNGTVSVNLEKCTAVYVPNNGYTGQDTFKYTVKDNDNLESNIATVTVTIPADKQPNLEIVKENNPTGNVLKGTTITYQVKFRNTGDTDAKNVVISDTISDKAEYVAGSCTLSCKVNGKTITWNIASLAPSQAYIIGTFKVKVTADSGEVKNIATVKADNFNNGQPKDSNEVINPITKAPVVPGITVRSGGAATLATLGFILLAIGGYIYYNQQKNQAKGGFFSKRGNISQD